VTSKEKAAAALERAVVPRGRQPENPTRRIRPALPAGLTERELEILRLVAAGESSSQIAQELVLSARTVERHISNIYFKLDVRTRAQATTYFHMHGLMAGN
jgi:DNA-binding NarL/FixJ family response regulator